MIKTFLLNYQQELTEKQNELLKSLKKNELSLKENDEFTHYIEMSEDNNYDLFSPQNFRKDINKKRISELREERIQLEEYNMQLKEDIEKVNNKLDELEQIMASIKISENEDIEMMYNVDGTISDIEQKLISIDNKIKLCSQLIDIDKNRCRLELQNLSKTINNVLGRI